jgi:TPR repeat protein
MRQIEHIEMTERIEEIELDPKKTALLNLIDLAAKGNIEAAEKVALGYYSGEFGDKNPAKAKKWASYAAKHGSLAAKELLSKL